MSIKDHFLIKWLSFTILRTCDGEVKNRYRKLEKIAVKVIKVRSNLKFNETCLINELLPTYTNIRVHDDAAKSETFVIEFRKI